VVAEFPSDAQTHEAEPGPVSNPLENVDIYLHAQDVDHNKQGWAAVVPALSPRRIRMNLYPPIDPADIYTKQHVKGDLLVESRRNADGVSEPVRVHLIRIHEEPKSPKTTSPPRPQLSPRQTKTTPRMSGVLPRGRPESTSAPSYTGDLSEPERLAASATPRPPASLTVRRSRLARKT
jgi:hypothetical protein